METRKVTFALDITLEEAQQFDRSDNALLNKIARAAYTREELDDSEWKKIKTIEDVCKALNICVQTKFWTINEFYARHLASLYKLALIRAALNKNFKPSLTNNNCSVYIPTVRIIKDEKEAKLVAEKLNGLICGKVKTEDETMYVIGGSYNGEFTGMYDSISDINHGFVNIETGLLACKSEEIAKHMSKYFAREIFNAAYMQSTDFRWESC